MAKKKVAKKPAKKVVKKAPKKASKKAPAKKTTPIVAPQLDQPVVALTTDAKKDVMEMPAPPVETKPADPVPTMSAPAEKHEDFTSSLTQEPPKKGFWARLFGK